jgi:hypothetical protein
MKDVLELFGDLPDYPGKRPPKNRKESPRPTIEDPFNGVQFKLIEIKGQVRKFYTIGNTAKVLNRTAPAIRKWERRGWIPAPTYRTSQVSGSELLNDKRKGYRLYSHEQVEILIQALKVSNLWGERTTEWREPKNWNTFIQYVKEHWIR